MPLAWKVPTRECRRIGCSSMFQGCTGARHANLAIAMSRTGSLQRGALLFHPCALRAKSALQTS
eukprot:10452843-Alexandrium_andersonii.AAC.1